MVAKKKVKASAKPPKRSAKSRKTKPRPAGRRAQSKQAIREGIVKAALSLFQTKGFDATTTKAIARKAGIAEGTVFNYFKSKDDIALHFFEQEVDQAMAAVRDNPRLRKAPLEEKLFALVQNPLGFLAPEVFWIYYMGALLYWLYDSSEGKQNTLAFLDRTLSLGAGILRQG